MKGLKKFNFHCLILIISLTSVSAFAEERIAPPLSKLTKLADNTGGAEVLYSAKKSVVDGNYMSYQTHYYAIKINSEKAAMDYGRIRIPFNEYYSDLELFFARVITKGGEVKQISDDAIQKQVGGMQDFYEERAQLTFAPPQIEPGSILEFQYVVKDKKATLPEFYSDASQSYWMQRTISGNGLRIDKVHRVSYEIEIDKNIDLLIEEKGPKKPGLKKKLKQDRASYQWKWKDLPAIAVEPAMPWFEELISGVRVSTTGDWSQLDAWSWSLIEDKLIPSQKINDIAKQLAPVGADKADKLRAVYNYIQDNVRYVYAHLGRGGYEPHLPEETMHHAYGDCKDQAVLAIALLNAMGVKAYPALVVTPRADRPSMDLVGLYFDHMIVWVPGDYREINGSWLDTTPGKQRYPGVSARLVGQPAFILNGRGGKLTKLNKKGNKNYAEVTFNYSVTSKQELLLDAGIKFDGVTDEMIRSWWVYSENREQDLISLIRSAFDSLSPDQVEFTEILNVDDSERPVEINAQINFGEVKISENEPLIVGGGVNQLFRMLSDLSSLPLPKARKQDWVEYYEKNMVFNLNFNPGEGRRLSVIDSAFNRQNPYFRINQSASKDGDSLAIKIDYRSGSFRLSNDEYGDYFNEVLAASNDSVWKIAFFPSQKNESIASSEIDEGVTKSEDVSIEVAKQLIAAGRFEEALTAATVFIESNKDNGEAWYILGVAQGFNAKIPESMRSFKRAEQLGFRPN